MPFDCYWGGEIEHRGQHISLSTCLDHVFLPQGCRKQKRDCHNRARSESLWTYKRPLATLNHPHKAKI